jgi:hypothetical protein
MAIRTQLFALTTLVALALGPASALATTVGLHVGPGKAVGEGSEDVRVGVTGGLELFFPLRPTLGLGWHAGYTYFPLRVEDPDLILTGSTDIIEVVPCMQIMTARPSGPNYMARGGVGVYSLHTTLKGYSPSLPSSSYSFKDRETVAGLLLGTGAQFGSGGTRLELMPTLHLAFTEGETTKYVVLVVAVTFGHRGSAGGP